MPDGFKFFPGLFYIKYIFMAAFDINLLILKKVKPNEVRKNVYHFLRYLPIFTLFYDLTNSSEYWKVLYFLYQKISFYKMVCFLLFFCHCHVTTDMTWPFLFPFWLFFNAAHPLFNLNINWNIFWKALDLGYHACRKISDFPWMISN